MSSLFDFQEKDRPISVHIHDGLVSVKLVDWPDLDEGLDIQGMLQGIRPSTRVMG
jgi:hypothetical protein